MKPYKNITSKNLPLLLTFAKIITIVSILSMGIQIIALLISILPIGMNSGNVLNTIIMSFPTLVAMLLGAGVVVAIILFEEHYRKQVEAYIDSLN